MAGTPTIAKDGEAENRNIERVGIIKLQMSKIFVVPLLVFLCTLTIQTKAQTKQKANSFNKENAYSWLNSKLELDPNDPINGRFEMELRDSYLKYGQYYSKMRKCKFELQDDPKELWSNIIKANLSDLNPKSLQIKVNGDKFSVLASTTNTEKKVIREIYDPKLGLVETRKEYQVWIGPFPNSLDEETKQKIKSVLSQLIVACGGKEDLF